MVRQGVELALVVDNQDMGWRAMSLGLENRGAERTDGIYSIFPVLPYLQKVRNGKCERGCWGRLILKKLS